MRIVTRYLEPELVQRLNQLSLGARSVVEGSTVGLHKSPLKGSSVEFRQHRAYVAGDEPRRLDWRVLARTDRPYIKEYDEETNLRCLLLLDASGSMGYGTRDQTKFDYAGKLVAALAYLMLAQTESVGMTLFGDKVQQYVPPSSSTGQLARLIDVLERATPQGTSHPARAMHESADRLGRRSLVVIVSDLFAPVAQLREGWAHLRHDRHEVVVLRILDRDEVEFPFRTWARFRGLEGERARLCEPAMIRKQYLDNFNRHQKALEDASRSLKVDLATFQTDRPLAQTLTTFLNRRAVGR